MMHVRLPSQRIDTRSVGRQARDSVFADLAVKANMLAMRGPVGTYNIGTGVEVSLNGLLAAFEHVVGHPVVREYAPARAGEVKRIALNAERARHELGWKPTVSLEDGLAQTLAWVKTMIWQDQSC